MQDDRISRCRKRRTINEATSSADAELLPRGIQTNTDTAILYLVIELSRRVFACHKDCVRSLLLTPAEEP
jgi:hypothetical protein